MSGVAEVRSGLAAAQELLALNGKRTVLFIDEIHRFNKAQQDALLPHVEDGTVTLIGATTENPYLVPESTQDQPSVSRWMSTRLALHRAES